MFGIGKKRKNLRQTNAHVQYEQKNK